MIKEQLLMERIIELIRSFAIVSSRILCFMNKNNIITVDDFMSIKKPSVYYDKKFVNMGPKTFQRIKEVQKIIAEENKKELKKVPVTTYEWKLV